MTNLNKLNIFPNQLVDHDEQECEGLTVAGIGGNLLGMPMSGDFSYAMALRAAGTAPSTGGADPKAAMMGAVLWGLLPAKDETFTAADKGELYVANWQNYSSFQTGDALTFTMKGVKTLSEFDEVTAEIAAGNPVNLGITWWDSFMQTGPDGVLPPISGGTHLHSVAVYDYDPTTDSLICEPHLGPTFGMNGYVKISRVKFSTIAQKAYSFDLQGVRWATIVGYLALRFNLYPWIPSLLQATNQTLMQTHGMITKWANAIEQWEGAEHALNNPGNLKYSTLTASWGATPGRAATDGGHLCRFSTYGQGFHALYNFLVLGAEDELKAFHQARTLGEFTKIYAGNPPQGYIDGIVNELGVGVDTLISSFLN